MKFNKLVKLFSLIILTVPLFSCTPNLQNPNNTEQNQIEHADNDMLYEIYLKMISNDYFSGTYEEFLEFIKGEQGEDGKDGEEGLNGYDGLVPYIGNNGNWWIGTYDTKISAKGENGLDGKPGEDGKPGTTTYQYYKQKYGYVGSEEDFLYDLNHNHLGIDKKHNISIVKWMYEGNNHYSTEQVLKDKIFANGEKINLEQYDYKIGQHLLAYASDNNATISMIDDVITKTVMFSNLLENGNFDINNYRAYKDVTIVLFYDLYTLDIGGNAEALYDVDNDFLYWNPIKSLHLNFSLVGNFFKKVRERIAVEKVDLVSFKFEGGNFNGSESPIRFDEKTYTLTCVSTDSYVPDIRIAVCYKNLVGKKNITKRNNYFPDDPQSFYITNEIKDNLYNLSLNDSFVFDMYIIERGNRYVSLKYTSCFIDKKPYDFKLKNNTNIIDIYNKEIITALKVGEDILEVYWYNKLIFELPVRVSEHSDFQLIKPLYNIRLDYSVMRNGIVEGAPCVYSDITIGSDLTKDNIGICDIFFNNVTIEKELFNEYVVLDKGNNTISFLKAGEYKVILYNIENNKCASFWMPVTVQPKNDVWISYSFSNEFSLYSDIKIDYVSYDESNGSIKVIEPIQGDGRSLVKSQYILIDYSAYPELSKNYSIEVYWLPFVDNDVPIEPINVDVGLNKLLYKNVYYNSLIFYLFKNETSEQL